MDLTKYFQFQGIWLRRRYFINDPDDESDGNPNLIYATPPQAYPYVAPSDPNNIFSTPIGEIYVTGAGFAPKTYKNVFTEYGLNRISFLLVDAWGDRKVIPLVENIYDAPEPFFEYRDGDYAGLLYPSHYGTDAIVPPGTTEIFASCTLTEDERCENHCIEIYRESDNAYICICKETEGPTLAPTQNRISKPKRPQPYTPSLNPPVKQAVIAQRRKSQKLAPQVKQAQERYEAKEAELLATLNPSAETLHEANRALIGWNKLRKEKEEADAYVAANTTESERQSGVIVNPGTPIRDSRKSFTDRFGTTYTNGVYVNRGIVHTSQQSLESEPLED
jgi:hypothetical protein